MKIDSRVLSDMLSRLKPIISDKTTSGTDAIQKNILVTKEGLLVTNFDSGAFIPLYTGADDPFLIPEKTMDLLLKMPNGDVEIEPDEKGALTIKCGKVKNRAQTRDAAQYPRPERSGAEGTATIDAEDLEALIDMTVYATGIPPLQYPIAENIHIQIKGGIATATALDGRRISRFEVKADGECEFLLPNTQAKRLKSFKPVGLVEISINNTFVTIKSATGDEFFFRLPAGEFIDTSRLFSEGKYSVRVDKKEMIGAIDRAREINRETGGGYERLVVLDIKFESVEFFGRSQTNDYHESIPAEADHELRIAFDSTIILDALKHIPEDSPVFRIQAETMPATIIGKNYAVVILPVRIQGN